ncbi:sigma-70 family RNA polymerase sigma factor [Haloferula sp. A504]|uniref:sigma-70 family RNA polymerase sigma factor n=1 Tax=Haloferula sp. A504 TaxID=3373601 RepID=UPI0031BE9EE6|nr:sigma-70 family RNA polymerase sigma factor [Verrucomicrobiaceae bacterium E54]
MPDSVPPFGSSETVFVTELTDHQGILHAFLVSLLPGVPEVDDILQRTNLVLWEKRSQFEPGTSFKSWALAVAYWEARAWMSERKRGDWLVVDDGLARKLIEHIEVQPKRPANTAVPALKNCLAKLRDADRLLVLSHHQHEKSLKECARIFDRTPESLSVSLVRIRAALRRCIKSELVVKEATQ